MWQKVTNERLNEVATFLATVNERTNLDYVTPANLPLMAERNGHIWLAEQEGRIVGYAGGTWISHRDEVESIIVVEQEELVQEGLKKLATVDVPSHLIVEPHGGRELMLPFAFAEYEMELQSLIERPTEAHIRLIVEADMERVAHILAYAFEEELEQSRDILHTFVDRHDRSVYVLEIDGHIMGTGTIVYEGDVRSICGVAVDPHEQGKGYGRMLLQALAQFSAPYRTKLDVAVHNEGALALYEKVGFRRTQGFNYYRLEAKKS